MMTSFPLRQFTMVPGQDIDPLFLCPLCQDSWANPVELVPCGDIFCQACISAARTEHAAQPMIMENFQCPQCHTVVQSEKKPNRMLLNTVLEVEVECRYCHWRGTREASSQHECEEGKQQKELEATSASAQSPTQRHQQPNAAPTTTKSQAELQLSSSTAPVPSKAHAPRRASGTSSQSAETTSRAASPSPSSPPELRGPRRAVQEIEGAFTAIEDDPTSTTFRSRAATTVAGAGGGGPATSTAASYDYALGNLRSSAASGSGVGSGSGGGMGNGVGSGSQDQVLSSPQHLALGDPASPQSSSSAALLTPGSNPSGPFSATNAAEPWRRYHLSQVEYDQLVGIFMMYDDGTGRLNHQQLRDLCFCTNFVQREDDVTIIFRTMDTAHKGYVSQEDFLLWLSTHRPDPSALFGLTQFEYTDAILQFRSVDPEFNGVIDANSFGALCLTNGHARTADEAMRYFHMCDERHTGYVSLQQFLRNLKTIKSGSGGGDDACGGGGGGMPPQAPPQPQPQPSMVRIFGSSGSTTGAQSPIGTNTPLRTAGSSDTGHGGVADGSFSTPTPQSSDYWLGDAAKAPLQSPQGGYREPYPQSAQQSSMSDYYPPGGGTAALPMPQPQAQQSSQQVPPPPQRFTTSLNSYPGDVQHQQQLLQQPYSQTGRSTMPASPQTLTPQSGLAQHSRMQSTRSRLHRPSARPQRDEECSLM
jgi:Ca2+-binding EF-hand superfamily protein